MVSVALINKECKYAKIISIFLANDLKDETQTD
jgi:hypothetical protein